MQNTKLKPHIENILKERYYLKEEKTWAQLSKRISSVYQPMYEHIFNRTFIPSSPTIMNLNTEGERRGTLSSCFILGVKDSITDIMESMTETAVVTKMAGGVGYDWSDLRGANENVKSISANSGGVMSFIGIFDAVLDGVRQGGKRRGAGMSMLSIYHPDILKFVTAKNKIEPGETKRDDKKYSRSNFSVRPDAKFYETLRKNPDKIFKTKNVVDGEENILVDETGTQYTYKMLWDCIIQNAWEGAEPGIFNGHIALDRCTCNHISDRVFSNPCLTGDTIVYVADGRGNVPIKTLVDEGKDVDVFSMDYNGNICIKRMMNPRLTQKQAKIYKVTFDSGMEIKATENHEFINTDGNRIELKKLKMGDSIKSLLRHEIRIDEAYPWMNRTRGQNYLYLESNGKLIAEHRILASHKLGRPLKHNEIVHHIDYNGKNNRLDNLRIMTNKEHSEFHRMDMIGEKNSVHRIKDKKLWKQKLSSAASELKNPNSTKVSNEELVKLIKNHSKTTVFNLMCANECLNIDGFPLLNTNIKDNKYRLSSYEEYCELAGVKYVDGNIYSKLKRQVEDLMENYNYYLNESTLDIVINKKCECCGTPFICEYENRHVTYCSHKCLVKDKFKPFMFNDGKLSEKYLNNKNTKNRLDKTLKVFQLYKNNKYTNFKKECKLANSIIRPDNIFCPSVEFIYRNSNSINTTEDLVLLAEKNISTFVDKKKASNAIGTSFNHKVVSVEYVGEEDVYDGTVDTTHTILIGGKSVINRWGKHSYEYILTGQCSEFVHIPYTSCNLGSINLSKLVTDDKQFDWKKFQFIIEEATVYLNGIIDNNKYPIEKIKQETLAVRPIGLGAMGLSHLLTQLGIQYDSDASCELTKNIFKFMTLISMRKSVELAKKYGKTYKYYNHDVFMEANKRFFVEDSFMGINVGELKSNIKKYGVYNSCFTSIAPTGTISYIADCSSGIEPVFGLVFTRKIEKENKQYEKVYITDPIFESYIVEKYPQIKEQIYEYVSNNKGSCQGCKFLTLDEQKLFRVAGDITPMWHLKVLAAVANNVSLSVSKTINLPKDCSPKDIADIYLKAQELGVIGVTVYRDECRQGILVHKDGDFVVKKNTAVKRPKDVNGELHLFTIGKYKYYAAVGVDSDGNPYEVFTGFNSGAKDDVLKEPKKGIIRKLTRGDYVFIGDDKEKFCLTNGHSDDTADALTRSISWGLRHGGGIDFVVHQLEKTKGSMLSFSKVLARTLKKYIKDGTAISGEKCPTCGGSLIRVEGCIKCPVCYWSKCG